MDKNIVDQPKTSRSSEMDPRKGPTIAPRRALAAIEGDRLGPRPPQAITALMAGSRAPRLGVSRSVPLGCAEFTVFDARGWREA